MPNDNSQTSNTWQKISTAPKDGSQILCGVYGFDGDWQSAVCWWERGKFIYFDEDDSKTEFGEPSHWIPIPEPPKFLEQGA